MHSENDPSVSPGALESERDKETSAFSAQRSLSPVTDSHVGKRVATLGQVRHRDAATNEIILVPTPSSDPNDPLNWYAQP
jgi:hypothetical protein